MANYILLGLFIGIIIALLTFLLMKQNIKRIEKELSENKKQLEEISISDNKITIENERLKSDYINIQERLKEEQNKLAISEENLKNQQKEHENIITIERNKYHDLALENNGLKNQLQNNQERLAEHKKEVEKLNEKLNKEFEILANKIFDEKSDRFTQINEARLKEILNPLRDNISNFEKRVEETYNNETREKASLRKELEILMRTNRQMSDDAKQLTLALKGDKKLQGNWGESQLEQLLQKSGLQNNIHYHKQERITTEDGSSLIPDYIVNLPDDKNYIIDSKVSLVHYEQYFNEEDETKKAEYLKQHIRDIKNHIDSLSNKNYQNLTNSPDFVFMYFALETALFDALQNDYSLFDYAFKKNIILVSNTTLLASLRTVSFIWTQENQRKNVIEIANLGGQLYDKFVGFIDNMILIGKSMDSAKDTYQRAMKQLVKTNQNGSYNAGTIIGQAEALKKLGANASKQLPKSLVDRTLE